MTTVYVAMIADRHTDTEPFVFDNAQDAITFASTAADTYVHPDGEVQITDPPPAGWLFLAHYSEEDSVWVIAKEVNSGK